MKLSKHDKNLVAMCWLAEIILYSLVDCKKDLQKNAPQEKQAMYNAISALFVEPHKIVRELNDSFNDEIHKVFDEEFQDTLCDLTLAIVDLYDNMNPKQLLKILRASKVKTIIPEVKNEH